MPQCQPSRHSWDENYQACELVLYEVVKFPSKRFFHRDFLQFFSSKLVKLSDRQVRVIKYGTLGRLVAALSDDSGQLDVSNVNTFLTTCRTFASTGDVVDELIKRSVQSRRPPLDSASSSSSSFILLVTMHRCTQDFTMEGVHVARWWQWRRNKFESGGGSPVRR